MSYQPKLIILFTLILTACSAISEDRLKMDRPAHHTDEGFKNLYITEPKKNFFSFLKMRYFGEDKWADPKQYADQIPWQSLNLSLIHKPSEHPQISWIGHSTFLIQYQGVNVLTDPVFCDRVSPFSFIGPKRYTRHVTDYTQLPTIDYVVISHNHYDHLDAEATKILSQQQNRPHYFVPLGNKKWLLEENQLILPSEISEMDWGDEININNVSVKAFPSQHWSARSLFDRFETLWASWRMQIGEFSFWFAGDTGYQEKLFKDIGEQMNEVDLALIPIGAYAPRHFMKTYHLNPEEAVKVHQQIKTKQSIGMHWGTYPLTAEVPTEPPIRLKDALEEANISESDFTVMELGETRQLKHHVTSN